MIALSTVWAIVMRHLRVWKRDINFVLFGLYWPILDVISWGYLGAWIQRSNAAGFQNYELVALLGIILWQIVSRGANIMVAAFTEELWANNIVNLLR